MSSAREDCFAESEAWRVYRDAFEEFAGKVRQVRLLAANPDLDRTAIDAALLDLEKARMGYNACRDVVAQQLMRSSTGSATFGLAADSARETADRVRAIAALRWEVSGKPNGTADDDWRRAEEIVRLAAA